MYVSRIQIQNNGPISRLDFAFPFDAGSPKPVVLVGENGSGKSIFLSNIVNGLLTAQQVAYPDTPEVSLGKVYKLRSPAYVKSGERFSFSRVDFNPDWYVSELTLTRAKADLPLGSLDSSGADAMRLWEDMEGDSNNRFSTNFEPSRQNEVLHLFDENCVLYLPHDRFEEPAWLNERNLDTRARNMPRAHMEGVTDRRIVNISPLNDNQNWVYDILFDRQSFERSTRSVPGAADGPEVTVFTGYSGTAARVFGLVQQVVGQIIFGQPGVRFGVGTRYQRQISVEGPTGRVVPNIFQLSSGQVALLNLALSVLRDFDMTRSGFRGSRTVKGIAIVDEVDLHLHTSQQHDVLPRLLEMFPLVQFIVTTHSPLFVLGMNRRFGPDGFALYRLPGGDRISPEEFSEIGVAYEAFQETSVFANDLRSAVATAQKPLLFVDGTTDIQYLRRAAEHLSEGSTLESFDVRDARGDANLRKVWQILTTVDLVLQPVVLLHDCESTVNDETAGHIFRRRVPVLNDHPIREGVENRFSKRTLDKAIAAKPAFVNIAGEQTNVVRGSIQHHPERWTVDRNEKKNLCDWLCERGSKEDFEHFSAIFELLRSVRYQFE